MKQMIAIVLATSLLTGIFAAFTSTEADMISPMASTVIAMIVGAFIGLGIATIAWIIGKVIN
jgi:hypothetical protein